MTTKDRLEELMLNHMKMGKGDDLLQLHKGDLERSQN